MSDIVAMAEAELRLAELQQRYDEAREAAIADPTPENLAVKNELAVEFDAARTEHIRTYTPAPPEAGDAVAEIDTVSGSGATMPEEG